MWQKKLVICQNYGHFANKLRSVIVSQNHYLNKILDVHPLGYLKSVIGDLFSNSAFHDSEISSPQLSILFPIGILNPQLGIIWPSGDIFC